VTQPRPVLDGQAEWRSGSAIGRHTQLSVAGDMPRDGTDSVQSNTGSTRVNDMADTDSPKTDHMTMKRNPDGDFGQRGQTLMPRLEVPAPVANPTPPSQNDTPPPSTSE
jgi:hypothetical protein